MTTGSGPGDGAAPAAPEDTGALSLYERLASLLEDQLALAGEGRLEELAAHGRARAELIASLPAVPPAGAHETLRRCELLAKRVRIELLRLREDVILRACAVQQGQRAADGYAPARRDGRRVSTTA